MPCKSLWYLNHYSHLTCLWPHLQQHCSWHHSHSQWRHCLKFLHTQHLCICSKCSQVDIICRDLHAQHMYICKFVHTQHLVIRIALTISSSCIPDIWSYTVHVLYVNISLHSQKPCKVDIMQHMLSKSTQCNACSQIHGMSTSGHTFSNPWKIDIVYSHTLTCWHHTFSHVNIPHVPVHS